MPDCTICCQPLGSRVMALPCAHVFHNQCIEAMMKHKIQTCPVCREPLEHAKEKVQKWTQHVNHNRRRYFKEPNDLNLMIWVNTEEKLEQYEYQVEQYELQLQLFFQ